MTTPPPRLSREAGDIETPARGKNRPSVRGRRLENKDEKDFEEGGLCRWWVVSLYS